MTLVTVALPIWNSPTIAWLPLEGLCNQKNIDFNWELIIAEEQTNEFGADKIAEYATRLKNVGCVSIKYIPLQYWIPLPQKWRLIANEASDASKYFMFMPADAMPPMNKLKTCFDTMENGSDWVGYRRAMMYNIIDGKMIHYDTGSINWRAGILSGTLTKYIKELPDSWIKRGVDTFVFNSTQPVNSVMIDDDDYKTGFSTDGLNNISKDRRKQYSKPQPPFFKTETSITDIVSVDVVRKMKHSYDTFHS